MDTAALLLHRLHFGFTITFHYLFPQLTMGLAPLIVVLQTLALRRKDLHDGSQDLKLRFLGHQCVYKP
jgi:cytochrome d ubiquinol oxidase subunit I